MDEFENYEFAVRAPRDAKNSMLRFLLILLYAVFIVAWLVFGFLTGLIPLLALIPVTTWILVFFTWRYVNVEYEYGVESGVITFSKIFGGRSRRRVLQFDLRDAERILPLNEHGTQRLLDDFAPSKEYSFINTPDNPDSLVALCVDEDGNRLAISFTADSRLHKLIKIYNSSAIADRNIKH